LSSSCSWCEWVSVAADLVGVIGGLLLAWAFLAGRRQKDALAIFGRATSPAPRNEAEFTQALSELRREVVSHLARRYTTVQVGAWMIAGAFFMRIISAIYS
jgi:hypothetical protein